MTLRTLDDNSSETRVNEMYAGCIQVCIRVPPVLYPLSYCPSSYSAFINLSTTCLRRVLSACLLPPRHFLTLIIQFSPTTTSRSPLQSLFYLARCMVRDIQSPAWIHPPLKYVVRSSYCSLGVISPRPYAVRSIHLNTSAHPFLTLTLSLTLRLKTQGWHAAGRNHPLFNNIYPFHVDDGIHGRPRSLFSNTVPFYQHHGGKDPLER